MSKESKKYKSASTSSEFVRISHKLSSTTNETQLIKIGKKYYKVRELG